MYAIETNNLSFGYNTKENVLKHISFNVKQGNYVCLVGKNGSGKSTIAKLLMGLLKPTEGEIKIFGEVLNENNVNLLRQRMGIVFQNPDNQFIGVTVRDDIAFGLENRAVEHSKMDDIILNFAKKVGMEEFLDKEPANLSGGQKQRVAIAGVLALNPDIIIFDEATAMLDPKAKREIRNIISGLRKENKNLTVISITHDIEEANLADEIIVLDEKSIYMAGKPSEIFSRADELKKVGLSLPFAYKLKQSLSTIGVDINVGDSFDEVVEKICH